MYILFAILSTVINLLFQYLSLSLYNGFLSLYVAMFVGTFFGLISKYYMDKVYIFNYVPKNKKNDLKTFVAYTVTGGFTTLIFWGFEISFNAIWSSEIAKYCGALIGLSLGYSFKYLLDKKYVF
jgi:putative flippase GtrA